MAEQLTATPLAVAQPKKKRSAAETQKFLKLARDRFKQAEEANKNQRQRELDDLRFYAGDQWPSDIKAARSGRGLSDGLPPVPARPCLTFVGKVREPVRQVLNQERGSDLGIELTPADDFGDIAEPIAETEIELREGLCRRIQRDSKSSDARTWAFARATIAGQGYYGVMTRYAPGKTNDQDIYVHRYYNQAAVSLDPAHEQPDGSDAEWAFVWADIPLLRYKAEHKKRNGKPNAVVDYTDDEWRAAGDEQPDWFKGDGDTRSVRVGDYFYTERETRTLCTLEDGSLEWRDELPEGAKVAETRDVVEKTIKWAKIDGCDDDVLDETDWLGPDMPIVKVLGEELQPYDKERRVEGMVRPMREPCMGNNALISQLVQVIALTPIPPIMLAEGQDEGYEQEYAAMNTRTLPAVHYKQTDLQNRPAPPPFPMPREAPIAPIAGAIQIFGEAIQEASISHPAMGQTDSTVKSAKHASLLREQSQQGTSNYLDNLMRSMRYEAQIINNLLYPIYGTRPGRLARIINGQGEAESVILHQPMTRQNGRPMPAPVGDPNAQTYTLTKDAQFNVAIKIARDYDTRRQAEATTIGDLLSAAPQLMTWFGDLFFKNQDGPGHTEMADRAKVMLDPKILAMLEAKKQGQDIPPQVQAQLQQGQQQVQQLTQMVQQLQQQLQVDAAKAQAQVQTAATKAQADIQIAHIDNAAKIEIARITAAKQTADIQAEAAEERLSTGLEQQHEVALTAMQNLHEQQMAGAQQAHQVGLAQQGQAAQADQQQADQAHEQQMVDQAAQQQQQQQQQSGGGNASQE